jgi:hypothetical protein
MIATSAPLKKQELRGTENSQDLEQDLERDTEMCFLRSGWSPGISVSTWVEEKTKEDRLLKKKKKRSDCVTAFCNNNKIRVFCEENTAISAVWTGATQL